MIKLNGNRAIRECVAPFQYPNEKGEIITSEIRVRYYAMTVKDLRAAENKARAKESERAAAEKQYKEACKVAEENGSEPPPPLEDEIRWLSDELAERIAALPDISDEKGDPIKITAAVLEDFDLVNLTSISKAIGEDLSPKVQPEKSPNG